MPFDSSPSESLTPPNVDAKIIADALSLFGPRGEKWCQHAHMRRDMSVCMISSLMVAGALNSVHCFPAAAFVAAEIAGEPVDVMMVSHTIVQFNDALTRRFDEVKAIMERAYNRALASEMSYAV